MPLSDFGFNALFARTMADTTERQAEAGQVFREDKRNGSIPSPAYMDDLKNLVAAETAITLYSRSMDTRTWIKTASPFAEGQGGQGAHGDAKKG